MNEPKQLLQPLPRTMEPMTSEQARELVSRYLKSFPSLNLASPEVYLFELAVLLCGYPLWAGTAAIERAKDTFRYPPVRAELRPLLEDQVRYVRSMQAKALLLWLDEQQALESPRGNRPSYAELKARYGENFGIVQCEVKPPPVPLPSWDEIAAFYRAHPERWERLVKPREADLS